MTGSGSFLNHATSRALRLSPTKCEARQSYLWVPGLLSGFIALQRYEGLMQRPDRGGPKRDLVGSRDWRPWLNSESHTRKSWVRVRMRARRFLSIWVPPNTHSSLQILNIYLVRQVPEVFQWAKQGQGGLTGDLSSQKITNNITKWAAWPAGARETGGDRGSGGRGWGLCSLGSGRVGYFQPTELRAHQSQGIMARVGRPFSGARWGHPPPMLPTARHVPHLSPRWGIRGREDYWDTWGRLTLPVVLGQPGGAMGPDEQTQWKGTSQRWH